MLKGKNLWILAGVAVVGYYLYKKNMAAKVIAASSVKNFTGDLSVPEYQNGVGVVPRDTDAAAARAYAELAKRKKR
jgi:6-phosphogluconolactonase (cycloisomerase 2 family)